MLRHWNGLLETELKEALKPNIEEKLPLLSRLHSADFADYCEAKCFTAMLVHDYLCFDWKLLKTVLLQQLLPGQLMKRQLQVFFQRT